MRHLCAGRFLTTSSCKDGCAGFTHLGEAVQAVTMKMRHADGCFLPAGPSFAGLASTIIFGEIGMGCELIAKTICKNIVKPMEMVDACEEKIFAVPYRFFL